MKGRATVWVRCVVTSFDLSSSHLRLSQPMSHSTSTIASSSSKHLKRESYDWRRNAKGKQNIKNTEEKGRTKKSNVREEMGGEAAPQRGTTMMAKVGGIVSEIKGVYASPDG